MSSNMPGREPNVKNKIQEVPSKAGRMPIKINKLEINDMKVRFLMEGDPILIDQTQTNLKSFKFTSDYVKPHKTTSNHIKSHKTTSNHITPHKTTSNHIPVR